mgnify:FL=1
MTSRPEHVEYCSLSHLSRLLQSYHILGYLTSAQEYRSRITTRVSRYYFSDLDCVISQEVVKDELARIAEHAVCVVPETEESEHVTIVIEELFQCIKPLIRSQRLH